MDRKEVLSILKKIKPGIADKGIVESMQYIYFSGSNVVTYNDKISILHPFKTKFKNIFVKADDFFRIIDKSKSNKIKMTEKGNFLNVRSPNMNVNLTTILDEEIIDRIGMISKSLKGPKWKKLPDDFLSSAALCAFAASKQESELTTSCVYINGSKCMATDNDRFASANMTGKMESMFIKASQLPNLVSIEPIVYAITSSWLHFKNKDNCVFSIRRVDGMFPDFSGVIDFEGTTIKLSNEILEGTDLAKIFIDKLEPVVTVKISKGRCIVSIKSDGGTSQHRSKVDYNGKPIVFTLNPDFLKEMLARSTVITLDNKFSRAKLVTDNFIMITSLLPPGE